MYLFFKQLLLPPANILILLLYGLLWSKLPHTSRLVLWAATVSLCALSLPLVSASLMAGLEPYPPLTATDLIQTPAKAIVVLSADQITYAPEFGQPVVGKLTLQRLRYAAWLHRQTQLPIIVSGGSTAPDTPSLAELMAHSLRTEFGVPVMAMEQQSINTRENAQFTGNWLTTQHIKTILLVTHAWHLPRAVAAFERVGIEVIPAPTVFFYDKNSQLELNDLLPSAQALLISYYALHEYIGQLWYRLYAWSNWH